ncbi:GAF and ANTAR domain-containing protein [Actinospica sp. MGRD01-02]|uniref:GAF and ANTAR domain-containing protein n=1 Tax=Actinospica acidithermotolerans TaxID=2828514 RepID=A0A941ILQ4_9ACTN|nr:GAF and ANTAR domain-containing protein [Actinospica acidithermotolerans]MBR7829288.1 GAF and ANTAR domain-containing protein [Actinospica acidithermotolerans]
MASSDGRDEGRRWDSLDGAESRDPVLAAREIAACVHGATPAETVERLCLLSTRLLPVDGASVSLMARGAARQILYATDEVATAISEAQYALGNGPSLRAFADHAPVQAIDLSDHHDAHAWPVFAHRAQELDVGAVFALPLAIGAIAVGTLELYRRAPGALSESDTGVALLLADTATLGVLRVYAGGGETEYRRGDGEMSWLGGQADFDEIHQATGMVMVQCGVEAEEALLRLRARAFTDGVALGELAREVVARRVRLDEDE